MGITITANGKDPLRVYNVIYFNLLACPNTICKFSLGKGGLLSETEHNFQGLQYQKSK